LRGGDVRLHRVLQVRCMILPEMIREGHL
jgi:hypothetical protein